MKKVLTILICLLSIFSLNVYAAKKTTKNSLPTIVDGKEPVKVYIFTKEHCPYCEKAKTFLKDIEETYGAYYDVVVLEVYDSSWKVTNRVYETTMNEVAALHNYEVNGVPFIVIGDKYYVNAWADTTGDEVKATILQEYVNENYKDIVAPVIADVQSRPDPHANDGIIIIGIGIAIVAVVGVIIYFGRKNK